jgi:hypothetical protein
MNDAFAKSEKMRGKRSEVTWKWRIQFHRPDAEASDRATRTPSTPAKKHLEGVTPPAGVRHAPLAWIRREKLPPRK